MKKLSDINESHWSEMNRRSQGITFRKEDDIDFMDAKRLYQYVISKYKTLPGYTAYKITEINGIIDCNPIIFSEKNFNTYKLRYMGIDDLHPKILIEMKIGRCKNVLNVLKENFKVEEYHIMPSFEPDWYRLKPLDGDKQTTNRFYLKVLDTFIDIIGPKIRPYKVAIQRKKKIKKLSKIEESHWSEMNKRSQGIKQRMEDGTSNLNRLKPVDFGCSVLWADQDLEINDNYFFKFDEIPDLIKNSKWRLPTRKDVDELAKKCEVNGWDVNHYCLIKEGDDFDTPEKSDLKFDKRGMIYNTAVTHGNEFPEYTEEFWGWTSEELNYGHTIQCYIITADGIQYTPLENTYRIVDVIDTAREAKLCVRLVKDK